MTISKPKTTTPLPISPNPKTFISAYGPKLKVSISFPAGTGRTKQSFKDECDINIIMAQYLKTGVVDFVNRHQARYGDVTGLEYQEAMQIVAESKTMFEELPSKIRQRFENDPAQFLDFVSDPSNASEAHSLGLLRPDYQPPASNAPAASVAAPSPIPSSPIPPAATPTPPVTGG